MKTRSGLFVCAALIFCMLCLLSVSVFAADSHRYDDQNPNAVYPIEPYSYETHLSPDGKHILRVRINEINHVTYYDMFSLIDAEDDTVLRDFDIHAIYNAEKGVPLYGVNWSPDGRFVVIDYPHTNKRGLTTLILDTEELDFWMPPSTLNNYDSMRAQDKTLPARDVNGMRPWKAERWISDTCVSLITEYINGEQRIWSRMVFDAAKCKVVSREWGDSADIDNPDNPVWTRAAAQGAPAYNTNDFSVVSPDGTYSVVVHAADNVSDADTWNALYESVTAPYRMSDYITEIELPLISADLQRWNLWHDISIVWSPDGRYFAYQSEDKDSLACVYDMETGGAQYLNYELEGASKARIIAFSVFDEVLYEVIRTAPTGEQTRELQIQQMSSLRGHINLYVSPVNGFADVLPTPPASLTAPTVKDGFKGFLAVGKTHPEGLDGLFRIGENYYYLRMVNETSEDGSSAYREYVCRADVNAFVFEGISMKYVHTSGGCFILDENDRILYAGTGVVASCGRNLIAINLEPIDDMYVLITDCTLYDAAFRVLVKNVVGTSIQEDGAVYVKHWIVKGGCWVSQLSYISADGNVLCIGKYDGDLSEFRK